MFFCQPLSASVCVSPSQSASDCLRVPLGAFSASVCLRLRFPGSVCLWHPLSAPARFCHLLVTSVCLSLPPSVVVFLSRQRSSSPVYVLRHQHRRCGGRRPPAGVHRPSSSSPPPPPPSSSFIVLVGRRPSSSSVVAGDNDELAQNDDHELLGIVWRGAGQCSGYRQLLSRETCVSVGAANDAAACPGDASGKSQESTGI